MSKNHLVPTPIVDKNGKQTTVLKKPTAAGNTTAPLPAPVTQTRYPPVAKLTHRIAEELEFTKLREYDAVREALDTYPPELINDLLDVPKSSPMWLTLCNLISSKESATFINEARCFYPHLGTENMGVARMIVSSLHNYPQLPTMTDYGQATEEVKAQCIALMTVTEMMDEDLFFNDDTVKLPILYRTNSQNKEIAIIDERQIIELLMERPEQARNIGNIIVERRTRDADLIKMILDDNNPLLAEGNL